MSFSFGVTAPVDSTPASAPSTPSLAVRPPESAAARAGALPSTRALFYALETAVASGNEALDDATESALSDALPHVANVFGGYRPLNAASAAALRSGSVEYGGKTLRVSETTASVAEACARRLRLDETQAYVMLRRAMDEGGMTRPTEATEEVVREVMRFYFRERLGTIKCAHALLARSTTEGGDAWERSVVKMLDLGFEENVWLAIERHMSGASASGPEGSSAEDVVAWAGQALEETVALLEVLFLLYYNRVKCSPSRFLKLANAFQIGALRRAPAAALELESHASQSQVHGFIEDIRALCNVILIAAMDLENLVDRFSGKSLKTHSFLEPHVLQSITEMMEKWQSDVAHGPTLLAWSTFLTLLPADAEFMPGSFSIQTMHQKANECGISALSRLLDAEQLRGDDTTVTLHKSVLKNLFSTILAAYDMLPVHRLPSSELNQLVDILRKLLAGQPVLCEQFWAGAREDGQEAPLFALLEGCRERFPCESTPLLRTLAALCEGHRAAECALAYVARLPTVALPVPPQNVLKEGINANADAEIDVDAGFVTGSVTAIRRLTSTLIPGGFIEAGMQGLAIDFRPLSSPLIVWAAPADGLHLCLTRLSALASAGLIGELNETQASELDATVLFLSKVLTHAPSFARPMLLCDLSEAVPKGAPTDILAALSLSLHVCSRSLSTEEGIKRTATVLQALTPLAAAEPLRTVEEVLEAPLLSGKPGTGVPGLIRAIRDSEARLGEYPLTIAVLKLVETLLEHGGLGDKLEAVVDHTLHEVAVRHVQWRYKYKAEKWLVHAAVQRVVYQIFVPKQGDFATKLRNKALSCLITDRAICFGVFAPLVYDANALRKLHEDGGAPRVEEVIALEEAIASVLRSLPLIVLHASENFSGFLERMLLVETRDDGAPFASSIASYAGYPYAAACFPLALPALVPLCAMAKSTPLAATLDKHDRLEILKSMHLIFEKANEELDAVSDASDLISAGIANQPEWVNMLFFPEQDDDAPAVAALDAPSLPTTPTPAPETSEASALTTTPAATAALNKSKKIDGALSLIWNALQDPSNVRARSPRCLSALARTLRTLWQRQPLLSSSVNELKVHGDKLWSRLATCLDAPTSSDATSQAHQLDTVSSLLSLFAIELETSEVGTSMPSFDEAVMDWCKSQRLMGWINYCLAGESCSLDRRQTQYAAQSFVLQCVASLEREDMTFKRTPLMADATLRWTCGRIRDALLAHPSAKDLRASGASNLSILEAVARESVVLASGTVMTIDPVHKLLAFAREMHVESAVLTPAPLGITGTTEYGDSYLYDSSWVRKASGCLDEGIDDEWGAPEGVLADSGRIMSSRLAETCLKSSVADARMSAICSLSAFMSAASSGELPKLHAGVFELQGSTANAWEKGKKQLLSNMPRDARRKLVLDVVDRLNLIVDVDSASAPAYVSPLAVELAGLLCVVTQLWSVSVSRASPQTPAEDDLEPVRRVISTVASILSARVNSAGAPIRDATPLVNPLLTAMLFAIRAWRAGKLSARTVQPSYELGQSALPLIPLICHAAANPHAADSKSKTTSSVALMLLEDIASELLPTSALLQVLSAHKILPPLRVATGDDDIDSVTIAALNTCLSLSQSAQGAEILLASDSIRQLAVLCVESHSSSAGNATSHDIYCLALRVTAMLAGAPLATRDTQVGADLVRFFTALETRMLASLAPTEVTLVSLREAEITALFFSRLAAAFGAQWQVTSPEGQLRARVACAMFLRWFAAPQVVSGVRCPRKTPANEALAAKPPTMRAHQAWFQATARGDSVREPTSPLLGTAPHGSPIADASTRKNGNAYSEAVAAALYRVAQTACEFLAEFPRAVDAATLGFDVAASLRDQCDAILKDDLAGSPAASTPEIDLARSLDALRSAVERVASVERV